MRNINFIIIFCYIIGLTIISFYFSGSIFWEIDDTNIYFDNISNWALGHGFFFKGGGEHLEDVTYLLWTIIGRLLYSISTHHEKLLLLINFVIISFTLFNVCNYLNKNHSRYLSIKSLVFWVLLGVTLGFIDWTELTLMETGLWFSLFIGTTILLLNFNLSTNSFGFYSKYTVLIQLLVICRPESMLLVTGFIVFHGFNLFLLKGPSKAIFKQTLLLWGVYAAVFFLICIWKLTYFGYPLPNTYQKLSSSRIDNLIKRCIYLIKLFIHKAYLVKLFIHAGFIAYILYYFKIIRANHENIIFLIVCGLALFIPLHSGSDHFTLYRFIVLFIPTLLVLWLIILPSSIYQIKMYGLLLIVIVFYTNSFKLNDFLYYKSYPLTHELTIAENGRKQTVQLNKFFVKFPKLPSQCLLVAGCTDFSYNVESIDLFELNNTQLAYVDKINYIYLTKNNASFNSKVFYKLKQDLFLCQEYSFAKPITALQIIFQFDNPKVSTKAFNRINLQIKFKETDLFCEIFKPSSNKLRIFAAKTFLSNLVTAV